jgi:hypothetical protein
MTQSVEEMINLYLQAWNYEKPEQYEPGFALCWDETGTYSDPNFPLIKGVQGMAEAAISALQKIGPRIFSIVRPVQAHSNTCFYVWKASFPDGHEVIGYDYIEYSAKFKIKRLMSYY